MRSLLIALIFLPVFVVGAAFFSVLRKERSEAASGAISLPSIGEPPKSEDPLIRKGWEIYTSKGCVFCHGPEGKGGIKNPNAQGGLIPALERVA